MPTSGPFRNLRAALLPLAALYAVATLLYGAIWMSAATRAPVTVELGFDGQYEAVQHALRVQQVYPGAPAERAGLRVGDEIVSMEGRPVANAGTQSRIWAAHRPGDPIRLTFHRPGEPGSRTVEAVFRRAILNNSPTQRLAVEVIGLYPIPFILISIVVLFLRVESPVVWVLALLFGGFVAVPGWPTGLSALPGSIRGFATLYQLLLVSVVGPLFFTLFSVFPVRSPLELRAPWLKWTALALGLVMALAGFPHYQLELPPPLPRLFGQHVAETGPFWVEFFFFVLGLLSLLWTRLATRDTDVRRKIRMVFWGTVVGVGPSLLLAGARRSFGVETPIAIDAIVNVLVLALFPLSFAYAILKHRVLDLPVLLRRSARYLLVQRGFGVLLSAACVCLTVLFALVFTRDLQLPADVKQPVGIGLGAVLGGLMLWGGTRLQRHVGARIDRAFFRSAYDARQILEDLARRSAVATDRTDLARLLESHLGDALHPSALTVYLRGSDDLLLAMSGSAPPELAAIAVDGTGLAELARRGQCWESAHAGPDDPILRSTLGGLRPECLVPITGRAEGPTGLFVLGARRSEEPYSGEDKRLLLSVAGQSGIALDNIRMAEEIAGRMEAEKRVSRELGIARDVQGRLLPQSVPALNSLELAAHCIQARSVGGDYYDFIELAPNQVGIVLADVSGKGIQAALLMANLQAHLRSQFGSTPQDPLRVLRQVNHMIWKSTDLGHFATLFLGIYSDASRRLTYVNCGHNAPLCLRADGGLELLEATATVLGAFEEWECSLGRIQLSPGDLLVAYSDGITEASRGEELFGETRLIEVVREHARGTAEAIAAGVLDRVQSFGAGEQSDDLTLLVGRVR